ncbi:MAG: SGNH/GDSL hydrolase family protein [Clostridiaceae bacterium]|nr:SGNH/GDSL hydrolase family protein [Clostridiaceae bacterium]
MNMKRKVLFCLLTVFLIVSLPFQVFAARTGSTASSVKYVSLGDSISYGLSADPIENSYANRFSSYLDSQTADPYSFINTGVPGWRTSDLKAALYSKTSSVSVALKNSRYVTVCIGANNLLGPIIQAVASAYGLNPDEEAFLANLENAIAADPERWQSTMTALYLSAVFPLGSLHLALDQGVAAFKRDWPLIISTLKYRAPQAKILVLTVYDPLPAGNQFAVLLDPLILSINRTIKIPATIYGYKVADTFTLFRSSTVNPVNFNITAGNFDPHPNNDGHEIIYDELVRLIS